MGSKTYTVLTSDISGEELGDGEGETVAYSLDGTSYEIDLSDEEADAFREAFQEYIGASRRVSRASGSARKATRSATGSGRSSEELAEIRSWAKLNGYEVSERGRVRQEILDAYDAA